MTLNSGLIRVHIATVLFGLAGLFAVSTGLNPVTITFGRTFFAALALFLVLFFGAGIRQARLSSKSVLSGVLLATHWSLFFKSIQVSSVMIGLIMFSVSAVFIALLEPWYFKERFKRADVIAALCVVVGIVLMVLNKTPGDNVLAGVGWGLLSSLVFAALQLLNRELTVQQSAGGLALVQSAVAFVVLLPFVFVGLANIQPGQWAQLVFLGCVCTALAHTVFISALQRLGAALASLISGGLEPVYGGVLAALFLAQYPTPNVLLGGMVVVIAVVWASRNKQLADI